VVFLEKQYILSDESTKSQIATTPSVVFLEKQYILSDESTKSQIATTPSVVFLAAARQKENHKFFVFRTIYYRRKLIKTIQNGFVEMRAELSFLKEVLFK
jgi:hypothetical protein